MMSRSCLRCHERKVRCDREHPCGRCIQANVECFFPENKRAPQIKRLKASSDVNDNASTPRTQAYHGETQHAHIAAQSPDAQAFISDSVIRDQGDPHVQSGNGVYQSTVGALEMAHKQSSNNVSENSSSHEIVDGQFHLPSVGILGLPSRPRSEPTHDLPLEPLQIQALWSIFKKNVAPMMSLLHKRSIEAMIHEACAQAVSSLNSPLKALILAISFSAMVSATKEQCLSILNQDRDLCISRTRLAVEQALATANLINAKEIEVLQAAVIFLLCLRWIDPRIAWAETAIVIRVAQGQGVHRDGQFSGLTPFNIQMRRRLWWHICILDMLCSEDQGTDTQIRPEMFDTKIPSNIDIDDLSPEMIMPPHSQSGFTDITLCIIQCEMMINLYWAGVNLNLEATPSPVLEQEKILSSLATRIEEQYLQGFDLNIPIQWLTAVIARLSLSKARVVSLLNNQKTKKAPVATNDELFQMAVEIVKFANLIQKNEATAQWAWLCKTYKQRHAMAFILSELSVRPISSETNQAWDVASEIYNQWQEEGLATGDKTQTDLSSLMERATLSRKRKLDSLEIPRDISTSLPIPQSILRDRLSAPAPATDPDIENSSTGFSTNLNYPLDGVPEFSFSAMDWLSGPL
ncbi:C6 transcription factor [Penicillium malachiteum]|uniref:C6 transcription factor n=1 Tax=Penicillium malachiteum TaxID=1324776 RepID=UPI0025474837|nr:C6 transcription factor [Penicillium malachiteum]KAJ5725536.1 C6 transcription factor [Penicillium malachiteum]